MFLILLLSVFAGPSQHLLCLLCNRIEEIEEARDKVRDGQKRAVDSMIFATTKRLKSSHEGDTVLIPVSNFDRGRIDNRNIMGYVLNKR